MDEITWFWFVIAGFVVGILIGGFLGTIEPMGNFGVHAKLGQAICKEEYDMDYVGYSRKELHCELTPKQKMSILKSKEYYGNLFVDLEEVQDE